MAKLYPFSAYDKYLSLKPDLNMWLMFAFLLRPYVIFLLSITNRQDKMGLINLIYFDRFVMILAAIAAIPAVLVMYAFAKRKPEASDKVRWIWCRSGGFLLASVLLNLLIVLVPALMGLLHELGIIIWVELGISVLIIYYLFSNERVRDTFADFPDPVAPDKK